MDEVRSFLREEDAISTVEVILILVVLVALVVLFRGQITALVQNMLDKVTNQANSF